MFKFLQKIFGDKFSFFSSEPQIDSVLGIDIGSSSIKIVELKKKGGKAVLETYGALALGPYAELDVGATTNLGLEQLKQALLDLMKESSATTNFGALSIPSSASLIFLLSLPKNTAGGDLNSIISTEARKYVPVPISEVSIDWWVIPEQSPYPEDTLHDEPKTIAPKEEKTEALVVAIHNDTLSKYRELLTTSNINSNFFEMEVFSSIRSTFNNELTPVVLMDFGASKTKLSIIEYGIVRVFHIINRGSHDITKNISQALSIPFKEAEQLKRETGLDRAKNPQVADIVKSSIDFILSETNTVVLNFEKKYNKNISKVVLTGGGALLRGLHEYSMQAFNCEVIYGDPFSKTEAPAFLSPILSTSGPEFAVAVGIALRQIS